jgi:hypothetical protein
MVSSNENETDQFLQIETDEFLLLYPGTSDSKPLKINELDMIQIEEEGLISKSGKFVQLTQKGIDAVTYSFQDGDEISIQPIWGKPLQKEGAISM